MSNVLRFADHVFFQAYHLVSSISFRSVWFSFLYSNLIVFILVKPDHTKSNLIVFILVKPDHTNQINQFVEVSSRTFIYMMICADQRGKNILKKTTTKQEKADRSSLCVNHDRLEPFDF